MGVGVSKVQTSWPHYTAISIAVPDSLEYGSLVPQGIYPTTDYDVKAVRKFIKEGLLAPFYHGLNEECDEYSPMAHEKKKKRHSLFTPTSSPDALLYTDPVECPICLLHYPQFLNYTRCCGKPMCTECFVQLQRSHGCLMSPAKCPLCNQPNLGVIHLTPMWSQNYVKSLKRSEQWGTPPQNAMVQRRVGPKHPNVVLVDQVHPNWQDQVQPRHMTSQSLTAGVGYVVSMRGGGSTRRVVVRPTPVARQTV
ncbi:hypothetical protein BC940DRAFT_320811 [Gongronella butleri]|nr:hypothetical protein BC940DRAFT_320811 [Gongronella butleri]